jgi:hypothetical protein
MLPTYIPDFSFPRPLWRKSKAPGETFYRTVLLRALLSMVVPTILGYLNKLCINEYNKAWMRISVSEPDSRNSYFGLDPV